MSTIHDIRKTVSESTPVLALVGATDAAVRQARHLIANASTVQAEVEARVTKLQEEVEKAVRDFDAKQLQAKVSERLDRKALQAAAQQVPALAVARALEVAGRAEAGYEGLAARGQDVVDRVRGQKATQDLIKQGKVTISRTKAAVTTARKAVDETANAALGVVLVGRQEATEVIATTQGAVQEAATVTEAVAKEATTTARKSATSTRSAARRATTGARKTASAAAKAAESGADKVGRD
jgi:heparin binding hemagglutinin HbhA